VLSRLINNQLKRTKKIFLNIAGIALLAVWSSSIVGQNALAEDKKKVVFVNSYHNGFTWSDGIANGIQSRFLVQDVWFKTLYMNAWHDRSPQQIMLAAEKVNSAIEQINPDIVITSDDIAAKYVISSDLVRPERSYVFAGVNWNALDHDFSKHSVTGIVEVSLINSLVDLLSQYASGSRIGFLSVDTFSARKDLKNYALRLKQNFDKAYFVNSLDEWQRRFKELQTSVDILILENPEGLSNWSDQQFREFVFDEAEIPIGSTYVSLAHLSLISIAKIPEEQGWWAADAAVKILEGESPDNIPVAQNKEGKLIVNLSLAEKLGVVFSQEILETAEIIK